MSAIEKLTTLGTPIRAVAADIDRLAGTFGSSVADRLAPILSYANGLYAFESALHILPDVTAATEMSLARWNDAELWINAYAGMADGAIFFAEDVLGLQFCLVGPEICSFDPETGLREKMADDLEGWAALVLDDYASLSGYPLAHEWQALNGPIPAGSRLVPVTPFVLGGEFVVDNVRAMNAVQEMTYRASIARQIRDVPEGTKVVLRAVD